jgi:Ala-tRNA(Pro) deacylase
MKGACKMKIAEYLAEKKVPYSTHQHMTAYTAQEVAAEEHVSGNIVAKAVVVRAGTEYVLCVLPASCKLDMRKVAKAVGAKEPQLADEQEMAQLFPDTEVGAEPPFGNLYNLSTFLDQHLAADEDIVFQAGTHRDTVRMKMTDYMSLARPKVMDLAVRL